MPGPDIYIAVQEVENGDVRKDRLATIARIAKSYRAQGKSVVIDASIASDGEARLKNQLNTANKLDALSALIIDEAQQQIGLKDLESGNQHTSTYEQFFEVHN